MDDNMDSTLTLLTREDINKNAQIMQAIQNGTHGTILKMVGRNQALETKRIGLVVDQIECKKDHISKGEEIMLDTEM